MQFWVYPIDLEVFSIVSAIMIIGLLVVIVYLLLAMPRRVYKYIRRQYKKKKDGFLQMEYGQKLLEFSPADPLLQDSTVQRKIK